MGAVSFSEDEGAAIDRDRCVECGTCARSGICPVGAYRPEPLAWPRVLRSLFSDPVSLHRETQVPGRGTEEMKTNDVTGRLREGIVGLAVEVGRPSVSASFEDIQRLTRTCADLGAVFEAENPITVLMTDRRRGILPPDILKERVLSALIEIKVEEDRLPEILEGLRRVSESIETVFSLGLSRLLDREGAKDLMTKLETLGFAVRPNGKMNLGLGRPLFRFSDHGD